MGSRRCLLAVRRQASHEWPTHQHSLHRCPVGHLDSITSCSNIFHPPHIPHAPEAFLSYKDIPSALGRTHPVREFQAAAAATLCFRYLFSRLFISARPEFGYYTDSLIYTIARLWLEGRASLFVSLLPLFQPNYPLLHLCRVWRSITPHTPRYHDKIIFVLACFAVLFPLRGTFYSPTAWLEKETRKHIRLDLSSLV